jgi:hypothetical protein
VPRRWWLVPVVLIVVAVGAVIAVRGVQRARYGPVYDERTAAVSVDRGGRLTLSVPDRGASVGDHWTVQVRPDQGLELVRSQLIAHNLVDRLIGPANGGGGGHRYVTFDARRSGPVTVTLQDCFQGCRDDRTRAASRTVTWTVTVR